MAAVPPLLLWFGLFAYLLMAEAKVRKAQANLEAMLKRDPKSE